VLAGGCAAGLRPSRSRRRSAASATASTRSCGRRGRRAPRRPAAIALSGSLLRNCANCAAAIGFLVVLTTALVEAPQLPDTGLAASHWVERGRPPLARRGFGRAAQEHRPTGGRDPGGVPALVQRLAAGVYWSTDRRPEPLSRIRMERDGTSPESRAPEAPATPLGRSRPQGAPTCVSCSST
jgi:hypothetical protein